MRYLCVVREVCLCYICGVNERFEANVNIKERISPALIASLASDVNRVNDNQYIGFHARLGQRKGDGSRLVSYYYFYRVGGRNGQQINYFIGNSDTLDAGTARRIAMQIEPHIKAGKDILKMKFEAQKSNVRLKDFWRFLGREFFLNKYKNSQDALRNIEVAVLPQLGSVPLDKLQQQLIELRVIKPLVDAKKFSQLRVVVSQFRALLQLAVDHQYLQKQPLKHHVVIGEGPAKAVADDHLSGAQIKGIYYRAGKSQKQSVYLYTLRLQILTGQPLSVILASYRQDIKGNSWLLRATNGKLTGKILPLGGPLKVLLKEVLKRFPNAHSLYLFPSKGREVGMDARAIAKSQRRFIASVHGHGIAMSALLKDIETAMINIGVEPLVVGYLFGKKLDSYLALDPRDTAIEQGLQQWYRGG